MKTTLYAIVPGDTREEAIDNSHRAFLELCSTETGTPGGSNPIFDRYRLYTDLQEDDDGLYSDPPDDGVYPISETETEEMMDEIWEGMVQRFRSAEDEQNSLFEPFTAARARRHLIYDERGRPVMSPVHYHNLMTRDDHWVIAALFSW